MVSRGLKGSPKGTTDRNLGEWIVDLDERSAALCIVG
jgi:hypothetical protein